MLPAVAADPDKLISRAMSALAHRRWKGTTKAERQAHARRMLEGRARARAAKGPASDRPEA
jgi:hypothetical protein